MISEVFAGLSPAQETDMTPIKTLTRAAAMALALLAAPTSAHEATKGDLMIAHPQARPNLPNRPTAAYMVISNAGDAVDRLVAAKSDAFGAIEIHTVEKQGDVMRMMPVEGIDIPAGGEVALKPGGFHLMMFEGAKAFRIGEMFPVTLTFRDAGDVEVIVKVDKISGGMAHGSGGHGTLHGNHGKVSE